MNRSICGVHFALGIPLAFALAVSPASQASADEAPRHGKQQRQSQECVPRAHAKAKPAKSRAQAHRKPSGRVRTVAQRKAPATAQPPARTEQPPPPAVEQTAPPEQPREIERQREQPPQPVQPQQPMREPEQGYQVPPQPQPPLREPEQQPEQGMQPGASCEYGAFEPGINERAHCLALAEKAQLQFEEIPGGAAIVLMPKPGYTMTDLLQTIDALELAVEKARDLPPPAVQERCYLFDLYRRTGGLPKVTDGRNMIRLSFTTSKTGEVMPLRTTAYQFACTPPQ